MTSTLHLGPKIYDEGGLKKLLIFVGLYQPKLSIHCTLNYRGHNPENINMNFLNHFLQSIVVFEQNSIFEQNMHLCLCEMH